MQDERGDMQSLGHETSVPTEPEVEVGDAVEVDPD